MAKKDRRILRIIVNSEFTFADLDPAYQGVDSNTGNIFCPFHDNYNSPAAKMYFDDKRNIPIIHCFKEGRNFTTFDFVEKILCQKREQYKDVEDFLEHRLSKAELEQRYELIKKNNLEVGNESFENKVKYIDNTFNEVDSTEDYIERLYLA